MLKFVLPIYFLFSLNACLLNPIVRELLWPDKNAKDLNFLALLPISSVSSNVTQPIRTIILNKSYAGLQRYTNDQLTATLRIDGAETTSSFTWASSNTSILTVSDSGYLTANATGPAMVTVKEVGGDASAVCLVNVYSGYVYASLDTSDAVSRLTMNTSSGLLTFNSAVSSVDSTPTGIAVDPFGKFAYTGNFNSHSISQFTISQSDGSLSYIGSIAAPNSPRNIVITPDGRYLYIAAETTGTIRAYSINSTTGTLTFINSISVASNVFQAAVDPTGTYLVALNPVGTQLSSFFIDQSTGNLTFAKTSGSFDSSGLISFHPSGKYIYIGSNPNLTTLSFDVSTGSVSVIGSVNQNAAPNGNAVHPGGKFFYSANIGDASATVYDINQTDGTLSFSSSLATGGTDIRYIAIDPTGQFAYIAQKGVSDMMQFSIDQRTGALVSQGTVNAGGTQWNLFIK